MQKMIHAMFNTIANKRIALFGFAFKANTGDTRESPAIYVTQKLAEERAHVVITDPKAIRNAEQDLKEIREYVEFETDPYKAAQGAHAVAILTEWDLFKTLDYKKIYENMEKPAFLFDGRNILDHQRIFDIGFNVYPIGKPPLMHF